MKEQGWRRPVVWAWLLIWTFQFHLHSARSLDFSRFGARCHLGLEAWRERVSSAGRQGQWPAGRSAGGNPAPAQVNTRTFNSAEIFPPTMFKGAGTWPTLQGFSLHALFEGLPERIRKPVINSFAAVVAGSAAVFVATPIESIKVGIQTWPGSTLPIVVQKIVKRRGAIGFFTGLDAMLLANVPYSLIFYGCYQPIRTTVNHILARSRGKNTADNEQGLGQMIAAGFSDMAGMAVFMPGELVRMRMMNDPSRYSSFFQAVPTIVRDEGIGMLFRGYRATLLRDIPYAMISFSLFEYLRSRLAASKEGGEAVSFGDSAVCSLVTSVVASTACIPLDVIKSNIMTSNLGKVSMTASSTTLFGQGGWWAFSKGYLPFVAINCADWGTSMAVYATVLEHYGGGTMGGAAVCE